MSQTNNISVNDIRILLDAVYLAANKGNVFTQLELNGIIPVYNKVNAILEEYANQVAEQSKNASNVAEKQSTQNEETKQEEKPVKTRKKSK